MKIVFSKPLVTANAFHHQVSEGKKLTSFYLTSDLEIV
jgi:hypothetical protein